MGVKLMPLPEEPFIRFAGHAAPIRNGCRRSRPRPSSSCRRRTRACRCWRSKRSRSARPILANARSEVLVDHCRRSNAGLFYADRDEFVECLKLLIADAHLRASDGPERHGVRAAELPVGRDPRQVRADVHAAAAAVATPSGHRSAELEIRVASQARHRHDRQRAPATELDLRTCTLRADRADRSIAIDRRDFLVDLVGVDHACRRGRRPAPRACGADGCRSA